MTKLISINPRYTATSETYEDINEFLEMCEACFGEAPELTETSRGYRDETGEMVLVYE